MLPDELLSKCGVDQGRRVAENVQIEEIALAEFALDELKQIITAGFAKAGCPNRRRLEKPFAQGYVFGFVYALIQEHAVKDETNGGRLMTDVCVEVYGPVVGPAILDSGTCGRAAGVRVHSRADSRVTGHATVAGES
jgi:hypothetical protein